jgi:CHAT domain-containing protein/tetratricopeptide (TPR) repeat protein
MKLVLAALLLVLPCIATAQESAKDLVAAGKVLYDARKFKDALATFEKALAVAETSGDAVSGAQAKLGIAGVKTMRAEFEEGIALANEARAALEAAGDQQGLAFAYATLGNLNMGPARYAIAAENYRKCASLAQGQRRATCLERLGEAETTLGHLREGMSTLQEAIAASIATGNKHAHASALGAMGDVHIDQGNAELAIHYHEKSIAMFREIGNTAMVSSRLNNMAIAYHMTGRSERALEVYRENLALLEKLNYTRGILVSKMNIGGVLIDIGRDEEGAAILNELLPALLQIDDPDTLANVHRLLARVDERRGDLSGALEHALQSVNAHSEEIKDLFHGPAILGRIYGKLGRREEARAALRDSIHLIESVYEQISSSEVHFFDERSEPYADMAALLIDEGRIEEAFHYAERYRSRVLIDVLRTGPVDRSRELTDDERTHERELNDHLVGLQREALVAASPELAEKIVVARRERDAFQRELEAAHPRLRIERGFLQPVPVSEIAARLPREAVLVEYLVTSAKTYVFVIADGAIQVRAIDVSGEELARQATTFGKMLAERRPDFRESARALHRTLIAPIADLLSKRKSWILIPDGPLWNLPFHALVDARGTYLAEQAAIVYAPSTAAWLEMSRTPQAASNDRRKELLAFGNPTTPSASGIEGSRGSLAPLPEAEAEVKGAARFYGAGSAIYLRDEATEERFKAEAPLYRVLHVAGHGILNDASPMHSYLLLASGSGAKEDGYLEAGELMQMDLGAELVVLSACDTARGKYAAGEGIIGFSWALFAARCRTQVVSQWKVDSAATSVLMRNFHRNVRNDRTKAASALQKTIVSMLRTKQYRHPFYWAGFAVLGDAL